jgi:hypothetical protein
LQAPSKWINRAVYGAWASGGGELLHYVKTLIDVGGHRSILSPIEFYFSRQLSLATSFSVIARAAASIAAVISVESRIIRRDRTRVRDAIEHNVRDTPVASRFHEKFTAPREPVSGFLDLILRSRYTSVCIMQQTFFKRIACPRGDHPFCLCAQEKL